MKYKNLIIYLAVLIGSILISFFLNGYTVETPFPYFSMSFKFGLPTIVGTLIAAVLVREESYLDRVLSLPLSVFAFSSATILPFVIFTGAFFAILKIENVKFLLFAILNLLALLIFKNDIVISNLTFVVSAFLILSFTKKISLLNLFLFQYFVLLDINSTISSVHLFLIPFCVLLLLFLYVRGKVRNSINVMALALIILSGDVTLSVILTAYSLLGISILFDKYRSNEEKIITSNVTIATIIISMSFLSAQSLLIPLIAVLTVFVEYNKNHVEVNHAV